MRKSVKSALSIFLVVLIMASAVVVANAANTAMFTKAFVDSNQYTYVTSATKVYNTTYADVTVSQIFKDDGSNSAYSYVWCTSSKYLEGRRVTKTVPMSLPVPEAAQTAGSTVILYAKGNNPSLDCRISGSWTVY